MHQVMHAIYFWKQMMNKTTQDFVKTQKVRVPNPRYQNAQIYTSKNEQFFKTSNSKIDALTIAHYNKRISGINKCKSQHTVMWHVIYSSIELDLT